MGTTAEKLQAALNSKNDVQAALEEQGVEVTNEFSTYGELIRNELTSRQVLENHINNVSAHNPVLVNATSSDGETYTATIDNLSELYTGLCIIVIPDTTSTSYTPTLNVNGLGAKYIRQQLNTNTGTTTAGATKTWLLANKPFMAMYNGTYWVAELVRTDANTIYGTVPISAGGTGATTIEGALENLGAAKTEEVYTTVVPLVRMETADSTILDNLSDDMAVNTVYQRVLGHAVSHAQIGGSTKYVYGCKFTSTYEVQVAVSYSEPNGACWARSKNNGVWTDWGSVFHSITAGASALTAGTSALASGAIYQQYE